MTIFCWIHGADVVDDVRDGVGADVGDSVGDGAGSSVEAGVGE